MEVLKPKLMIENLTKVYDGKTVLNNLSFDVKKGEFLSVLGPSGCGKTTLLRIIIGLEEQDSGMIYNETHEISNLKPVERGMGIVFQSYALFPNMTVLENVSYALKFKMDAAEANRIAKETLVMIGMEAHLPKKPGQLSGGQQQRVAIARTLATQPDVILLDEPISALDVENREIMKTELKEIQKNFNATMIFITHDQEEAFYLSDRIMVMNNGVIEQIGTPQEIYSKPKNDYVKRFVVNHIDHKLRSMRRYVGEIDEEEK
ncbi:ABC transporter ATP-binding protein [Erysipelothrix urinaevulpis]|uniref:ABC transporter ATP-binding protein n=1 Tax=Erysipelothrix urinaevulpis TaxID=2683717 RepID=UPI00135BA74E|nr:ABC transporter ATP-binding protein [Erysipelothrix urinaevulpis]